MNDSPLNLSRRGKVFAGDAGTDRQSNTFPSLCVSTSGRWYCAFRSAPMKTELPGQRVLVTMSDDEGNTWSEPSDCFRPPELRGRKGTFRTGHLTELSEGRLVCVLCWVEDTEPPLPFFNEGTEGLLDARIFLSESRDRGHTWSLPIPLETPPFEVPTPTTGPILDLGGGVLACQFELNKPYDDPKPWRHRSILQISRDGGETWADHSVASDDPEARLFYWDQRPGVMKDGRILDLFWTYDRKRGAYLNIHARESADRGRSWSPLRDTGVPGQPAAPVEAPDGRIAMVYVDRTSAPAIKCRVSPDGGTSWPEESESVLFQSTSNPDRESGIGMTEAWVEMSRFSVGLPATALTNAGSLLVVYYAGNHTDETGIHWVLLG